MRLTVEQGARTYIAMWVPPEPEIDFEACWVADAERGEVVLWNAPCGNTAAQAIANADHQLTEIMNEDK
jgi:hypothetical protein